MILYMFTYGWDPNKDAARAFAKDVVQRVNRGRDTKIIKYRIVDVADVERVTKLDMPGSLRRMLDTLPAFVLRCDDGRWCSEVHAGVPDDEQKFASYIQDLSAAEGVEGAKEPSSSM